MPLSGYRPWRAETGVFDPLLGDVRGVRLEGVPSRGRIPSSHRWQIPAYLGCGQGILEHLRPPAALSRRENTAIPCVRRTSASWIHLRWLSVRQREIHVSAPDAAEGSRREGWAAPQGTRRQPPRKGNADHQRARRPYRRPADHQPGRCGRISGVLRHDRRLEAETQQKVPERPVGF